MAKRLLRISPSIIATNYNDPKELEKTLRILERAQASMVHLDVMDGIYVKNKTFNHEFVDMIKNETWLMLDVHLMVDKPDEEVDKYIKAGADIITVHYDRCKDIISTLKKIKSKNILAGIALNPKDPTIKLRDILKTGLVDIVLVMGVNPGAYGQTFIPGMGEKVAEIREMDRNVLIEFDGGVTIKNAKMLAKMGVNILVSGNTIFKSKDIKKTIWAMRTAAFRWKMI